LGVGLTLGPLDEHPFTRYLLLIHHMLCNTSIHLEIVMLFEVASFIFCIVRNPLLQLGVIPQCMHTHTHTCILSSHACTHTCMHTYMHTCIHTSHAYTRHMHTHVTCMHTHVTYMHTHVTCTSHACIHTSNACTHTYMHTHIHAYTRHMHAYTHHVHTHVTCMHTYMHTHVTCTRTHIHVYTHMHANIHTCTHKLYIYPVRQKAKEIISFLQDDERLREARKAAKITRDKYVGYSSEELQDKYSEF